MERKKRKYSFDEKEKLARLCAKYKEEYDNHETVEKYDPKKRKFTKCYQGIIWQVGTFCMNENISKFQNDHQRSLKVIIVQ